MRINWRGMELPSKVAVRELTPTYGEFVVEPFEQGFGITVGNSLRRVLLSSLEGSAITSMKIRTEGGHVVPSEFSTIPGVLEDVTEIVLNIKSVIVKVTDDRPQHVIRIETNEKGEIKAGDIVLDMGVEIINPELHIATLTDNVRFEVELVVESGRGYVPVADAMLNRDRNEDRGSIPLDASYSPVLRVQYIIEPTRVGQKTTYDRLVLKLWTDGSIEPNWALVEAAKILRKHLNPFIQDTNLGSAVFSKGAAPRTGASDPFLEELLSRPLSALNLSVRATNSLDSDGVKTIRDLVVRTEDELMNLRNFGSTSLDEVKTKLRENNLTLGMRLP
ncbi:MAG: DNA-directed RNA polymerase subunit alpha [Thermoguttaceae bacterium]|nr:DNA-directed RNA polymerase subunit alpha [Thermoguttaceae bacterium]